MMGPIAEIWGTKATAAACTWCCFQAANASCDKVRDAGVLGFHSAFCCMAAARPMAAVGCEVWWPMMIETHRDALIVPYA
jgi:hypothetical protein